MGLDVYGFIEKINFATATATATATIAIAIAAAIATATAIAIADAVDYSYPSCNVRCNILSLPSVFPIFYAMQMAYHKWHRFSRAN